MDIASLILGIAPLLIATLQQYGKLYRCFKRFRKYKSGVEELLESLKIWEVVFQNETELLLTAALGQVQARALIKDPSHDDWSSEATEQRLQTVLGESKDAIRFAAQNVQREIRKMEKEIEDLQSLPYTLKNSFKYSFSESRLQRMSQSIRNATIDYRTLRAQLQDIAKSNPEATRTTERHLNEELDRVRKTQAAAKRVYEVLANACSLHTNHHAQFSLAPVCNTFGTGMEVKFQIAYRHLSQQQIHGSQGVLWFVVESVLSGRITTLPPSLPPPSVQVHKRHLPSKRPLSPSIEAIQASCAASGKRARVRSASPVAGSSSAVTVSAATSSAPLQQNPAEPYIQNNLCTQLRTCKNDRQTGSCIGWLENSAQWKHRVLHSSGPGKNKTISAVDSRSLESVLLTVANSTSCSDRMTVTQRLRLAKLLSSAVLNFHNTPWMSKAWSSADIILYKDVIPSHYLQIRNVPNAFVEVPVKPDTNAVSQSPDSVDSRSPLVHNSVLFALGVMLLELAFEKPLELMRTATDFRPGMDSAMTDLRTALRQSRESPGALGIKYHEIVQKCLWCDFGHGSDLDNPSLQSAIYRDVISELDTLEIGLRQLGIS